MTGAGGRGGGGKVRCERGGRGVAGWEKPIPPSSGHPRLELTLLGQVLNRAFYYFYHTKEAREEQRCSSVSFKVSQPQ